MINAGESKKIIASTPTSNQSWNTTRSKINVGAVKIRHKI